MGRKKLYTADEVAERVKKVWGDTIILDKTTYINMSTKCRFICKYHGEFWSVPDRVVRGHGCRKCGYERSTKRRISSIEYVVERLKELYGDAITIDETTYVKGRKKARFICKKHGEFWARVDTVLSGHSCNLCGHEKQKVCLTDSLEEAQAKLNKKSNNTLVIVKNTFVNSRTKCHIICKNCSYDYYVAPTDAHHCPMCTKYSMEKEITNVLIKKGIKYIHDKALKGCHYRGSKRCLRPDFYIETDKGILWIECDGAQHFVSTHGEEELNLIQAKDTYKNEYCKKNNICIIRMATTYKWATKKHVLLENAITLFDRGIDSETKEINFNLFWQYDFNRE